MTTTDRRRLRGQHNRAALIHAAVELFVEQGYDGTTVEQIATRAGLSPRTFHHNFPTKEAVLFDGYAARLDEAARRVRTSRETSLWGALAEAAEAVAAAIAEQPELFRLRARLYRQVPALRATMLRINEEWIDAVATEVASRLGAAGTGFRARLAATFVNGANRVAIDTWAVHDGLDIAVLVGEALELLRPAIEQIERASGAVGRDHAV